MSNNQYFGLETFFNEDVKFFKDVYIYGTLYYDFRKNNLIEFSNVKIEGNLEVFGSSNFYENVYFDKDISVDIVTARKRLDVGVGGTTLRASAETGKVGIGSAEPEQKLDVLGSVKIDEFIYDSVNSPGANGLYLSMDEEGIRWTALSPGSISVEDDTTTDATRYLTFVDVTTGTPTATNVSSSKLTFNPSSGTLSATVFTSLSDINSKYNISTISYAVEKIKTLRGVKFNWRGNKNTSFGVIAQEIEKFFPELVYGNEEKTVNYDGIIGILIEAIKEQQMEIESIKENNNKLETIINNLSRPS